MAELGLPSQLKLLTQYHNGLILVTGSVGSGKSTTLAALVEEINLTRRDHIITLEDPIEYLIPSKSCHVTQREVHTHTVSFADALRGALREDPDVIMVGEMRDLETISLAITASETGHLVLGTLHTGNAARTLDRVSRCLSRRSARPDSRHGQRISARHHQSATRAARGQHGPMPGHGNSHEQSGGREI